MDEMQKNLAKRRAKVEGEDTDETKTKSSSPAAAANWSRSRAGSESPAVRRRTFGSGELEKDIKVNGAAKNATPTQLEAMKDEILKEMQIEVKKAKDEIIDFIRAEFAKR